MKKTLKLFLFALGLGASFAYAAPNYNTCMNQCLYELNACHASGSKTCSGAYATCIGDCARQ
jgi:hypothetical protein